MGRDEMILMWAASISRARKGWALKIKTFVGPEMAMSEARVLEPTPPNDPSNGFALNKIIKSKLNIKKQVYW